MYDTPAAMTVDDTTKLSKFMSFILRHDPGAIGLTLDVQGWADVEELLAKSAAAGTAFTRDDLMDVVENSAKKRFTLSSDKTRIRAAQGHSVKVHLGLSAQEPPDVLYHGTAEHLVDAILREGLKPKSRQQVHLSTDEHTARQVGMRHGKPAFLIVQALHMHEAGHSFFLAENGVWLTDHVPPAFVAPSSSSAASATTSRQPKPSR